MGVKRERGNGGGRGRAKRQGINTLFSGEALFGPLAHTRAHTQISNSHTHTHGQSTNVYLSF